MSQHKKILISKESLGYTLIELMAVIALTMIGISLALSSVFQSVTLNKTSEGSDFLFQLNKSVAFAEVSLLGNHYDASYSLSTVYKITFLDLVRRGFLSDRYVDTSGPSRTPDLPGFFSGFNGEVKYFNGSLSYQFSVALTEPDVELCSSLMDNALKFGKVTSIISDNGLPFLTHLGGRPDKSVNCSQGFSFYSN